MSPDTFAVGVFSIVGTLLGGTLGLVGERLARRIGKVECQIDKNWRQDGATRPDGGPTALERRIQVTLLNRKELPVTVTAIKTVYYKGGNPVAEWAQPDVVLVPETGAPEGSGDLVNIPAYTGVTRIIRVLPGRDDKMRELEQADRAELVAEIVGARDIREPLDKLWTDP